jgi:hypothetical protein
MILLTPQLHNRLLANGRQRDVDHVPVVKFFNPVGAATWLATELDEDHDTMFGLADLGFGCPEVGFFSLLEMSSVRLLFGLGIERDIYFEGAFPLSVYAEAARKAGRIVLDERRLLEAAALLEGGRCTARGREGL